MLRWLSGLVAVLLLAAGGAYVWALSPPAIAAVAAPDPSSFDAALVERGGELAAIGDCVVCHTAPGGAENAGGLALPTPFGTLYSTNITPDVETGIGGWSEAAFIRAMRQGLDRDGQHLYPAFPYDHFTRITDPDLQALYAWLMSEPAVVAPPQANNLRFPFNFRPLLAGWKLLFLTEGPQPATEGLTDEEATGEYLVKGLAHCGACHSPRNPLGAVKASQPLGGGTAEGWAVPALAAASIAAVPWALDDYADYLFDGWDEGHGIAAGPMTAVVDHLYDANEDDVYAMVAWLALQTPEPAADAIDAAVAAAGALDWPEGATTGDAPADDTAIKAGEAIFATTCAKCHKARVSEEQPASLALTFAVIAPDPRNFLHVVVGGVVPPYASVQRKMPPQGKTLSDEDIVNLAAFVRWRFTDLAPWSGVQQTLATIRAEQEE